MMNLLRAFPILFVLPLCCVGILRGQGITGSIHGMVRDPSGGAVPGVELTAVHLDTNAAYTSLSNELGVYVIRGLPIGSYGLTAEAVGFRRFEATGVLVRIDESVRVDVRLQPGEVTESVRVAAGMIAVDTQSSTLRAVMDRRRVEELPLDGRDPADLIRLVAGVARHDGSGLTVDGGRHDDHYDRSNRPLPNPDALAGFSVQTDNFSAEHGRNMGAVVSAVTRSGTNRIRGSAFGYVRNSALNAAHFFAPPNPEDPTRKQGDGLKRSQFGATLGGPLWLGNLYDGRDRTFFFVSYQGTRIRRAPTTQFVNTLTTAERRGDFSGVSTQLIDPFSGEPYPNNRIPVEHHCPVARYILDNLVGVPREGRQIGFTRIVNRDDNQIMARMDHNLSAANVLMGRFTRSTGFQPGFLDRKNVYNSVPEAQSRNTSMAIRNTHTFGSTLINELTFSVNLSDGPTRQVYPEKDYTQLGIEVSQDAFPQYYFEVEGLTTINTGDTNNFIRGEYQMADTLRWTRGMHQLSVGGEFSYGINDIVNNYFANGRFSFTHAAGWTGHGPADFLIGKFGAWTQGLGEFKETRFRRFNLFIHDTMRWRRNLSIDLGLRWEPFFPYYDRLGKMSVWAPGRQSTRFVNAPEGILYPGDPGVLRGAYGTAWRNLAPRVGFAYDLTGDGRAALRAGYGIFYDFPNTISTNSQANQGPFGTRVQYYGNELNRLSNPWGGFPGGNPLPVVGFDAVGTAALDPPADVSFVLPHIACSYVSDMRNAYMQSWNLTLERQFGEFFFRTAYVGSKGTALVSLRDGNAPPPDPTAATATTNERRPLYPYFGRVTLVEPVGNSTYHGLQLTAERRFHGGYSVHANYTWSKAIDNNRGSANRKLNYISVTNPLDHSFERSPADFDRTHVFNFSGIWELPGRFANRMVTGVLGGWSVTSILRLHSGEVFTVTSGQDNARTGQEAQRADLVGDPYALGDNRPRGEIILDYLNRGAFATNALGTYGNLGRNTFRGPGYASVDVGLHKRFSVTEDVTAQFRFEMFNAFNRVNLDSPIASRASANFMRIIGAADPRILQCALRFVW